VDRETLEQLIPHQGDMCFLSEVKAWDLTSIVCAADAPTPAHPLARNGRVAPIVAVEYAAQATAVHGSLLTNERQPREGVLAKLVDISLEVSELPSAPFTVQAEMLSRSSKGCLYRFDISAAGQWVVSGRLMIAFPVRESL